MNTSINWTWSNIKDDFIGFWPIGTSLPTSLLMDNEYSRKTRDAFILGQDVFWEPLKEFQPLTWKSLNEFETVIVQSKKYPELINIVVPANDLVVLIEPFDTGDDLRNWNEIFASLPIFLHGYYKNFNGMQASFYTFRRPVNLPSAVGNWRRVSDFRKEENLHKATLRRIESQLGDPENIKIIIETEWDDLVMINSNKKDGKIYVAPRGNFDSFFELEKAEENIDKLCAHVLSGSIEPYYLNNKVL